MIPSFLPLANFCHFLSLILQVERQSKTVPYGNLLANSHGNEGFIFQWEKKSVSVVGGIKSRKSYFGNC